MGSIISHMLGARKPGIMPYVNINDGGFGYHGASWLGLAQNPFRYGGYSYGDEGRPFPTVKLENFQLVDGLSRDRLMNRVSLKQQFELMRHRLDGNKTFDHIDSIDGRALDLIVSGRTQEAFDLDSEDAATRELYGPGWGEQALLARRLVQAGVRFVALNTGYWDDHGNIKGRLDDKLPRHDRAVGALIQDLANRDMLENTLVVTAGEFGRTPTINGNRGRDHWPLAQSILIAGGGYRHGQVIGTTNAKAEHPTSGDVGVEDFCAIIYHALGLKPTDTIKDHEDRPVHLLPGGRVPEELL
jgi:hypothetical protein